MARAASLRLCMKGLFVGLVASEAAAEALILTADCLNCFDRGKEGFELIRFKLKPSKTVLSCLFCSKSITYRLLNWLGSKHIVSLFQTLGKYP